MRKIIFISAVLLSAAIISCSGDSDSNVTTGYVDPGLGAEKQLISVKSYNFSAANLPDHSANANCGAIIYQGASSTGYTGIAVGLDSTNPNFSLKVYWPGGITIGTDIPYTGAIIKVTVNNVSTTVTDDITLTISTATTTANDGSTVTYYNIIFRSPITVGSYTISVGDSINAYAY